MKFKQVGFVGNYTTHFEQNPSKFVEYFYVSIFEILSLLWDGFRFTFITRFRELSLTFSCPVYVSLCGSFFENWFWAENSDWTRFEVKDENKISREQALML